MIWHVYFAETAEQDLQEIYDYIANDLQAPTTAHRLTNRIIGAANSLKFMPHRHRLCSFEPMRSMGWRVMPIANYLVFYLPDKATAVVNIIRILYKSRDIANLL